MLQRLEFAPLNLGANLTDRKLQKRIIAEAEHLGWQDIRDQFRTSELACVLPNAVTILAKDNLWCYIAESGYAVVRYHFAYDDSHHVAALNPFELTAQELLNRIEFHNSIERPLAAAEVEEATTADTADAQALTSSLVELINRLRSVLQQSWKNHKHANKSAHRHVTDPDKVLEYAVSVFVIHDLPEPCVAALLSPRSVGCSSSVSRAELPDVPTLAKRINAQSADIDAIDPELPGAVPLRSKTATLRSSWSSVVVQASRDSDIKVSDADDLISLVEFRLQSTWLAATHSARAADHAAVESSPSKALLHLKGIQQDFERIRSLYERRLGTNAPPDPTAALANVEATSDLEREITTAERALSQAIARAEYEVERSNAKGRKAIELFGLVFASSGLAGLLLPLPINSEVISTHPFAFATWLLLTFFGAWFVAKQRF